MSTCPRCKGHLTEGHRCPRRRGRVAVELVLAALAGGLIALASVALLDPEGRFAHIDTLAALMGVLAGVGLDRLLRA